MIRIASATLIILSLAIGNYVFAPFTPATTLHEVTFKITNIRNHQGNFVLCFFADEHEYKTEAESIRKEIEKEAIHNGELSFTLKLPEGTYGLLVLDDENKNDEMDFRLLLPKEGIGFSNHVPKIKKPNFSDFKFEVPPNNQPVTIQLRYLS